MQSQFLINEFVRQFEQALEMMAGEKPSVKIDPAKQLPASVSVWEQRFNVEGGLGWFAGTADAWISSGNQMLAPDGIGDADEATARSTLAEILGQAFSGVARALTGKTQLEVATGAGEESERVPGGVEWQRLEVQTGDSKPIEFFLSFSDPMISLEARHDQATPEPSNDSSPASTAVEVSIAGNSKTLDLLLDVELPVSVSFGRAQLALKDVIKLTTGSIVELNRTVGEPVEVIVNNCVIARGEVVVVEGNFGVRVQQVISKQERLRTLY